jgi:hypothetical protein
VLHSGARGREQRNVTALHDVERAMTAPVKRFERPLLGHLTRPEMIALPTSKRRAFKVIALWLARVRGKRNADCRPVPATSDH